MHCVLGILSMHRLVKGGLGLVLIILSPIAQPSNKVFLSTFPNTNFSIGPDNIFEVSASNVLTRR